MQDNDHVITVTTDIAAPPETVWQVLTEVASYAEWHPIMSLDGTAPELTPGERLPLRLSGGLAGNQAFTAELTQVTAPRLLAWQGGAAGVFFGRHTFELQALPEDGTRFTDTERYSGTMAASVVTQFRALLEEEYAQSAAALKERAEQRHAAQR